VGTPTTQTSDADKAKTRKAIKAAAEKFSKAGDKDGNSKLAQLGSQVARGIASGMKDGDLMGRQIIAVPFSLGVTDEADAKFLSAVFSPLYCHHAVERADEAGLVTDPLPAATDEALVALGRRLAASYTLGAWLTREGETATLTVRLMKTEDASVAWTAQYPVTGSDAAVVSDQITTAVLAAVPKE
jgi:hypothetical protein